METKELYQKYLSVRKVSTDTRHITPGSVFFALKGPNFNANQFANEALDKGASLVVLDDKKFATNSRMVVVNDSLEALQQLATFHRNQLQIPVIGLTGSNGKTTSKELVYGVLSKKYKTFATRGNLNNHIGVPLSILSIDDTHEIAVIEMGANHVGEIAVLCGIANPTHGFITNIGKAHIGTFGSFENIIRGKSELYHHLIQHKGTVWINSENRILSNMAKRFDAPLMYPTKGDYYNSELVETDPYIKVKDEKGQVIATHLMGAYNFENVAVALCIGKYFEVDAAKAAEAIAEYQPANMRSEVVRKNTNTIILDAYNANPSSMEAAIKNLKSIKADNKVVILGDMYELGDQTEREHGELGKLILDAGIPTAYLCGEFTKWTKDIVPHARYFQSREELIQEIESKPIKNSTILIKASRGMGLEKIMDFL
ncbi:MAG: UDP-N-acetylmuramoyl-tripeptide--D-alanyl-D-alanine ligase [Flammeovirgaceae bacterium]|nr:UDP-N-acetylmuramoyl-tripeptide--D-alanyl-D-alanine ligase [Flammeovirgaceae bacterium]